jgi:hypothetical protein
MAELFHVGNATAAIESPNEPEATNVHICLHLKGPTKETEVLNRPTSLVGYHFP